MGPAEGVTVLAKGTEIQHAGHNLWDIGILVDEVLK
jgi:hypothetical protein